MDMAGLFLDLLKAGLVYRKESSVGDPVDMTVVNEQVIDGRGWRSGALSRRKLNQWFLKITQFADDLLGGWRRWTNGRQGSLMGKLIGKSKARVALQSRRRKGSMFLPPGPTRCSGRVLLRAAIAGDRTCGQRPALQAFIEERRRHDCCRYRRQKRRASIRASVEHPLDPRHMPVYVANFVPWTTAPAQLRCPAHDQRDLDFARNMVLASRVVAEGDIAWIEGDTAYTGPDGS
jgi:leucyl-tRNA synthetase